MNKWIGVTYFSWSGFSIREGLSPFNIHISWSGNFYIYIHLWGTKGWFWNSKEFEKHKSRRLYKEREARAIHKKEG